MNDMDEIHIRDLHLAGWALLGILFVIGLAFIGRSVTPDPAHVLRWEDWRMLQARRQHQQELALLQQDLNAIAQMAQAAPDPVAAQILRSRIAQHTALGVDTLALPRAHVQNAADALHAWAGGQIPREELFALITQAAFVLK